MASIGRQILGERDVNTLLTPSKQRHSKDLGQPQSLAKDLSFQSKSSQSAIVSLDGVSDRPPAEYPRNAVPDATSRKRPRELFEEAREEISNLADKNLDNADAWVPDRFGGGAPYFAAYLGTKRNDRGEEIPKVTFSDESVREQASEQLKRLASPTFDVEERTSSQELPPTDTQTSFSGSATVVGSPCEPTNAQRLRTRLQSAMFRVQTSQYHLPTSVQHSPMPPATPKEKLEIRDPPEQTMRRYRKRMRRAEEPSLNERLDGLLPAIDIDGDVPEAESTWGNEEQGIDNSDDEFDGSPATTRRNEETPRSTACSATPSGNRYPDPQHDAKGANDRAYGPIEMNGLRTPARDYDLTSSAVKGRAADSLLQLGLQRQ